jgi:hypothetical protein
MSTKGAPLTSDTFLAERIALADVDGDGIAHECFHAPAPKAGATTAVVTLPVRDVEGVTGVWVGGHALGHDDYLFVPGNDWVAFKRPLGPGDAAEIAYDTSSSLDVVIGNDDARNAGQLPIVFHHAPSAKPKATGSRPSCGTQGH